MASEIQHHADFSRIRYGQCWEDADILCEALRVHQGGRFLSIGSAGDNSFALLAQGATHVTIAEMNPAQVACIELRRAAYLTLSHEEFLQLLGIRAHENRWSLFKKCTDQMTTEAQAYWTHHRATVAGGVVHGGKFENYFRLFRDRVLPLAHSRRRVEELLRPRSPEDRATFYERKWDNWRWRAIFKVFFSRFTMGRLGRDPAFFRYVEGSVAERILARTRHALVHLDPSQNPYLQFILTGTFGSALPLALRPESFETIKCALAWPDALTIVPGSLENVLSDQEEGRFDGFNLSDIFEYMSEANTAALLARIAARARPGARLAYWNMLAPRARPESLAKILQPKSEDAARLFEQDKAFFYSRFVIEEVTTQP